MLGSASRIEIRNVSADFCAMAGKLPAKKAAAKIAAPSPDRTRMSSLLGLSQSPFEARLCQMALYHCLAVAGHGNRGHFAAAFDRDAAARVKAAARRDIGRIRHRIAETDV